MIYFSVIIPVYNCERYLKSAIDSVLNQPVKELEIILIDDGSTDGSNKICDFYSNKYENISVIHQENQGVSIARNQGINRARGKYILFLDADDLFVENAVNSDMINDCEKGYDVLMYSSLISDISRKRYGIDMIMYDTVMSGGRALPISGHFGSCVYQKKMLIKNKIYFDEQIRLNEDEVFKMKAMYSSNIIKSNSKFLYIYNSTPGSVMRREKNIYDYVRAWEKGMEWLDKYAYNGNLFQAHAFVRQKILSRQLLYSKLYIQQGHSKEELYQELQRINAFESLRDLPVKYMLPSQQKDLLLFQKDFSKFVWNAKIEGMKLRFGRLLLKIPLIRCLRDIKRMPWTTVEDIKIE